MSGGAYVGVPVDDDRPILAVIILTRDEVKNLTHALDSFVGTGARFFIVDSGSTDGTVELAQERGCTVTMRPFVNYAEQLNWAIAHCPHEATWIMRLDADEMLTPELRAELIQRLPTIAGDVGGIVLKRRVHFWGRWIRHGGYYPTYLLRLWRRGLGQCEQRAMDEHIVLAGAARTITFAHDFIDENHKGLTFWTDKHNKYADREVLDMLNAHGASPDAARLGGQASARRWAKTNLYARAPLFIRAFLYWIYRYFFRLGFLDGAAGLVFHFLQGFWYRFLVDAKLYEREWLRRERR